MNISSSKKTIYFSFILADSFVMRLSTLHKIEVIFPVCKEMQYI
jgi:hypothetical protein